MRRLQRDRSRLQPRPNRRRMQQLQKHSQQTNRRQVQTHRRQRFQSQSMIKIALFKFLIIPIKSQILLQNDLRVILNQFPNNIFIYHINNIDMKSTSPSSKNKYLGRFRTIKLKQNTQSTQTKQQQAQPQPSKNHIQQYNKKGNHNVSPEYQSKINNQAVSPTMVQRLYRHIQYLQKRLKEMQGQMGRYNQTLFYCQNRLMEKESQCLRKQKEIMELQGRIKGIQDDKEQLSMNYDRLTLKYKMEKLSHQLQANRQTTKTQLKHKNKQGKFSSPFLPAPFHTTRPVNLAQHLNQSLNKSAQNQSPSIHIVNHSIDKDKNKKDKKTFNDCLNDQYKKLKRQNKMLVKETMNLKDNNMKLQEQLKSARQLIHNLKIQREKNRNQYKQWLIRSQLKMKQCKKDNVLLMSKLKSNETLILQLTDEQSKHQSINNNNNNISKYITLSQIKRSLHNLNYNVQIIHKVIDISYQHQHQHQMIRMQESYEIDRQYAGSDNGKGNGDEESLIVYRNGDGVEEESFCINININSNSNNRDSNNRDNTNSNSNNRDKSMGNQKQSNDGEISLSESKQQKDRYPQQDQRKYNERSSYIRKLLQQNNQQYAKFDQSIKIQEDQAL